MQTLGGHKNDNVFLPIVFAIEHTEVNKWFTEVLRLASSLLCNSSRKHAYIILTPLNPTFI